MSVIREFAQTLKEQLTPSQVVGRLIPVKKAGAHYKAVCPFHQDSDPSLMVNDQKGLISCFVCNDHRDVIQFWQDVHKIEKPIQAMKALAEAFGVPIPEELTSSKQKPIKATPITYKRWINNRLLDWLPKLAEPQSMIEQAQGAYRFIKRPFTQVFLGKIRKKADQHYQKSFQYPAFYELRKIPAGLVYPLWSSQELIGFAHFNEDNQPSLFWLLGDQSLYARTGSERKIHEPLKYVLCPSLADFLSCPLNAQRLWLINGFNREFASKWEENLPDKRKVYFYSTNEHLVRKFGSIATAYHLDPYSLHLPSLKMQPIAL